MLRCGSASKQSSSFLFYPTIRVVHRPPQVGLRSAALADWPCPSAARQRTGRQLWVNRLETERCSLFDLPGARLRCRGSSAPSTTAATREFIVLSLQDSILLRQNQTLRSTAGSWWSIRLDGPRTFTYQAVHLLEYNSCHIVLRSVAWVTQAVVVIGRASIVEYNLLTLERPRPISDVSLVARQRAGVLQPGAVCGATATW